MDPDGIFPDFFGYVDEAKKICEAAKEGESFAELMKAAGEVEVLGEMLRPGQCGVQALRQEPIPESGSAQHRLLLYNRSSFFCSVQQKLLLCNRSYFCSTEATSAQQKLLLFSRSSFC